MPIQKSLIHQLASIALLPVVVVVVVPLLLLWWLPQWNLSYLLGAASEVLFGIGLLSFLMSMAFYVSTVILFVRVSQGLLPPRDPFKKLVVRSYYRHTRNPMILGVLSLLLSLALIFDSVLLLGWCACFFMACHIFLSARQEPDLLNRFGGEYEIYQEHVPRWWPRRSGWRPEDQS